MTTLPSITLAVEMAELHTLRDGSHEITLAFETDALAQTAILWLSQHTTKWTPMMWQDNNEINVVFSDVCDRAGWVASLM